VQPLFFALDVRAVPDVDRLSTLPSLTDVATVPVGVDVQVCKEEAGVVLNGLRLLYNLCYR
jgi:hypothetical protein